MNCFLSRQVTWPDLSRSIVFVSSAALAVFAGAVVYRLVAVKDSYALIGATDPELGTAIKLPVRDVDGKLIPVSGDHLILYLGQCTSCALNSFDNRKLHVRPGIDVILVLEAPAGQIPSRLRRIKGREVLADPDQRLSSALNAQWVPRCAVLDTDLKVKWIQPDPKTYPEGVTYE